MTDIEKELIEFGLTVKASDFAVLSAKGCIVIMVILTVLFGLASLVVNKIFKLLNKIDGDLRNLLILEQNREVRLKKALAKGRKKREKRLKHYREE